LHENADWVSVVDMDRGGRPVTGCFEHIFSNSVLT